MVVRPGGQHSVAEALAAALLVAAFVVALRAGWGGDLGLLWMENLVLTALPLLAAWACWRAARRDVPSPRAWRLLGWAMAAWGLASGVVSYVYLWSQRGVPVADRTIAVPGLADLGFLGFFPLAILALLRFPHADFRGRSKLRTLLDAGLIMASVFFVAWASGVGANLEALGAEALRPDLCSWLGPQACAAAGILFGLANPLGDILLASIALFLATFAPRVDRASLLLVSAGLLAITAADIDFSTRWLRADNSIGNLLDAGWVLGFVAIALAAHRSGRAPLAAKAPRPESQARQDTLLALIPYLPVSAAFVAAARSTLAAGAVVGVLFWTLVAILLLLLARQGLVVLENQALSRRLAAALERVEAQQAARTQLLNNITHDIMNPLSPVRLQVHKLRGTPDLGDRNARAVEVIHRNVEQVISMVSDLKDLANVEAGRLRLDLQAVDGAAIARAAADSLRPAAEPKQVEVVVEAPDGLPLRADPVRVTQILLNFLSNAVKFSPAGGRVTLRVHGDGDEVRFDVQDKGRGLAPEESERLFRPFSQVHDRSRMDPSERGTGLGLYICKSIAEQHGGSVACSSAGLGQGSTFTVRLPREPRVA